MRGEPYRRPALSAYGPQVARITEHDAVVPDVGKSQQLGACGVRERQPAPSYRGKNGSANRASAY
jgi:hypothetical protein